MSEFQARPTIPYEWGEKARCPACSAPDLEVQHQASGPDQLRCTACGMRFELELDGPHLRVTRWPDLQMPGSVPAAGSWFSIDELSSLLKHPRAGAAPAAPVPPLPAAGPAEKSPGPAASGSGSTVWSATPASVKTSAGPVPPPPVAVPNDMLGRVKKLVDLGSTAMEVRAALAKDGVPAPQIEAAMAAAAEMVRRERERQTRKMWGWLVVVAVLLPLALWGGIRLQQAIASRQPGLVSALRATVAPNLVQALGVTTPVVQPLPDPPDAASGTPIPCPATPAQAAALFGGRAETWSKGPNGWIRIDNSGTDVTIHIPYGMIGAYFRVSNQLILVEVPGPAQLSQAPSLAISCP